MHDEWEYNAARISGGGPNGLIEALNKLGKEGWEAWGRETHPDGDLVLLKRKKPRAFVMPELPLRALGKRS